MKASRFFGSPIRSVRTMICGSFGVVVVAMAALAYVTLARIDIEAKAAGLPFTVARLERAVGYGGLIHNFKNAVLRGAREPDYIQDARSDIDRARTAIERIDRIQGELGLDATLETQRAAIEVFSAQLDIVSAMHAEGRSVAEIDEAVRLNDQLALDQIAELHSLIARALQERLTLLRLAGIVLSVLILVGIVVILFGPILLRLRLRNRALESFTGIAAHDLRGPLQRIRMMSDHLAEDLAEPKHDDAKLRQSARSIGVTATGLDRAAAATLDYVRAGRHSTMEKVSLAPLLTNLRHLSAPPPAEVVILEPLPVIDAPMPEIEIVLRHLLEIAVSCHSERAPKLQVVYRQVRRRHRLSFAEERPAKPGANPAARMPVEPEVDNLGLDLLRGIVAGWDGRVEATRGPDGMVLALEWPH